MSYVCSEDIRINTTKSLLLSAIREIEKLPRICDPERHTVVGSQRTTAILQNQRDFMKEINGFAVHKGIIGCREVRKQKNCGGINWPSFIATSSDAGTWGAGTSKADAGIFPGLGLWQN